MNHEASVPETFVKDPKKAQHMAIAEDALRDDVKGLEREAEIYAATFEKTGDPLYDSAAQGKRTHAEARRQSIDETTDEVGEKYDEMTRLVDDIRGKSYGYTGEQSKEHRVKMEEHLAKAMTRYGLIGSASEVYQHTPYSFARHPHVQAANSHADKAQSGRRKAS